MRRKNTHDQTMESLCLVCLCLCRRLAGGGELSCSHFNGRTVLCGIAVSASGARACRQKARLESSASSWSGLSGTCASDSCISWSRKNLYRSLHDNIPDGVISTDTKGIIKTFNPAAEILFSMDADEMVGRNLAELVPDPYRGRHIRHVNDFTGDGSIYLAHEQVIRKSRGKEFEVPMKIRLKAIDVDGETVKFCVVQRPLRAPSDQQHAHG